MGVIRGSGPAAERLRAFVRERVRKDGAHYERGAGSRLARHLKKGQPWVSNYIDNAPSSNADFDTTLAICRFFGVNATDFEVAVPTVEVPTPPLTRYQKRALKLMERMNERGQRSAVQSIAAFADAFPRSTPQESVRRTLDSGLATTRKARGSR